MTPAPAAPAAGPLRLDLAIDGMTCASCVARVERRLQRIDGVSATVNLATERAAVTAPAGIDPASLVAAVEQAGYGARILVDDREDESAPDGRRLLPRLVVAAAVSIPVALLAMVPALRFPGADWLSLVLSAPVVLWAGWPFHRAAAVNLRHGSATMDTLVSVGTLAAFAWSAFVTVTGSGAHQYFEVATVVTAFILIGRVVEDRSRRRAGDALRSLVDAGPREVSVVADDRGEHRIPVSSLVAGQVFAARPGERIAADGVVVEGSAAVDASAMTGESVPVEVSAGDDVTAGTVAANGFLLIRALRVGSDTRLARLVSLVEEAQLGKTRSQRLADRVAAVFVPIVIGLAVLTFAVWAVLTGDVATALSPAIAVLIVACPCALGLATPIALLVGTGRAAQHGILISGPRALEQAGRIDTVVFDKTGTLTTGVMTLVDAVAAEGGDITRILELAAAAERGSEHPVGRAIATARVVPRPSAGTAPGQTLGAAGLVVSDFRATAGAGVSAVVAGRSVIVTAAGDGLPGDLAAVACRMRGDGLTAVAVAIDGAPSAVLGVGDPLREDAAEAVTRVRALGAEPLVLSGDHPETVRALLAPLGVSAVGGVTPEAKAAEIRRLSESGRRVAMVGDGVNDAAALATADLGIAMGSGSDAAIEAGDLTLLRPAPVLVADGLRLSRRMLAVIRGNLFWAFAYNVAALPVAALGLLDPMIAGAAMAFSSVFVVLNSLRLRRF